MVYPFSVNKTELSSICDFLVIILGDPRLLMDNYILSVENIYSDPVNYVNCYSIQLLCQPPPR